MKRDDYSIGPLRSRVTKIYTIGSRINGEPRPWEVEKPKQVKKKRLFGFLRKKTQVSEQEKS